MGSLFSCIQALGQRICDKTCLPTPKHRLEKGHYVVPQLLGDALSPRAWLRLATSEPQSKPG